MNFAIVLKVLGAFLLVLGLAGLVPLGIDWSHQQSIYPWITLELLTVVLGGIAWFVGRRSSAANLGLPEGFAITAATWTVFSLVSGVAIALNGDINFIQAWFESMSGFTTTGATVMRDIEALSPGLLIWRCMMQWIGGIGIVVMSLALLPLLLGGSGYQVYKAEVPGLEPDRMAPHIRDTARILFTFYLKITVLVTVGLLLCGNSWFDSICHAFTTVATGGFANYNDSVEGLNSVGSEWVIIVGMFIGGMSFSLLIRAFKGKPLVVWNNSEFRLYVSAIVLCWLTIAAVLGFQVDAYHGRFHDLMRDSLFQVVSIITSSGFCSGYDTVPESWNGWPPVTQMLLVFLMLPAGCAGSTSGGIKQARFLVAWKAARKALVQYAEPARVVPIRLDGKNVKDNVVVQTFVFLFVYAVSWLSGSVVLGLLGNDLTVSFSASLSCLSNIGPALGSIGADQNYAGLNGPSMIACIFLMLLGRLEFFGVLILLSTRHWRK